MDFDTEELYKWIDQHPLTRPKRNINRDFADARNYLLLKIPIHHQSFPVPLVEILKHHFPKKVELHNYSSQNAMNRKLDNWHTLNRKVLSKLEMGLSKSVIEDLAQGKPGVIEKVLNNIKTKIEKIKSRDDGDKSSDILVVEGMSGESTGSMVIPVKVKSGTKVSNKKMVPSEVYDQMENDLKEKDDEINTLKNKVKIFQVISCSKLFQL